MMTNNVSRCPHVATIGSITAEDYTNAIEVCFAKNTLKKEINLYSK